MKNLFLTVLVFAGFVQTAAAYKKCDLVFIWEDTEFEDSKASKDTLGRDRLAEVAEILDASTSGVARKCMMVYLNENKGRNAQNAADFEIEARKPENQVKICENIEAADASYERFTRYKFHSKTEEKHDKLFRMYKCKRGDAVDVLKAKLGRGD